MLFFDATFEGPANVGKLPRWGGVSKILTEFESQGGNNKDVGKEEDRC